MTSPITGDTSGHPLLDFAVEAAGGLSKWERAREVRAQMSSGGLAFNSRLRGAMRHFQVVASARQPRTVFSSFPKKGYRGVFDSGQVHIESDDGHVVASRSNAREVATQHRFRWDDLDLLYFKGYALWSYLNEPFYLTMPGFQLSEGQPWSEGDETWHRLDVIFPPDFPAHSQLQSFFFDDQGRVRRHDYTGEVFGPSRTAAQYLDNHRDFGGITAATRRRVYPRRTDGAPLRLLTLVWINLEDFELA